MSRFTAERLTPFGLVVLALAALFCVASVSGPAASTDGGGGVPPRAMAVTSTISSCPAPGTGRVAVFAAPSHGGGQGQAAFATAPTVAIGTSANAVSGTTAVSVPAARIPAVTQPGRLWLSKAGFASGQLPAGHQAAAARQQAAILTATGPMAQGLDAEQTAYPPDGSAGTVSGVECSRPGTDFWFLGGGPVTSGPISLHLVNPDSQPAAVDAQIFTDTGPLQGDTDTGIAVPPGGAVVQPVSKLVQSAQVVALHVRTSAGRVTAAVQTSAGWWPAAAAPASQVVIPGLPGSGTGRRLYLVDPGAADAEVAIQAITPAGPYEPAGAGGIDVPSGSVVQVDVPSLNGIPAAVRLRSGTPVTAAMLAGSDAFTAATAPVEQQGVIADNPATRYITSVVASAPDGGARIRIATAGTGGSLGQGRVVPIAAGHTANVRLPVPSGAGRGFAIVISPVPGSGPVYAGRVLWTPAGGAAMISPVLSAPSSVRLPAVSDAAAAANP